MALRILTLLVIKILGLGILCYGQDKDEQYFISLSTSKCRAIAMGSAFMAVSDDLVTSSFNPATFDLYREQKNFRLTFFFNPITPVVSLKDNGVFGDHDSTKKTNPEEILRSLGLLFKGIAFSVKFFEGGFVFSEESLYNQARLQRKKFFHINQFWNDYSNSFILRFRLAPQVAIGFCTSVYNVKNITEQNWDFGTSYGVQLKPNKKMSVGVVYIGLSKELPDYREPIERIVDDTIHLGFTFQPNKTSTLSLDIRNLNKEENNQIFEVHAGFEQIFFSTLALRGGYFQENSDHHYLSGGIGLINENNFFRMENRFGHEQFVLNYSIVLEKHKKQLNKWHFLSFTFRV